MALESATDPHKFEYKVTPYSIVNYSSRVITIKSVFEVGGGHIPKEYIIQPGESVDYEVDYEEEAKQLMRLTRDDIVKKQDYLNIIFDDKHIIKSKI
jgi:hypothetical protein